MERLAFVVILPRVRGPQRPWRSTAARGAWLAALALALAGCKKSPASSGTASVDAGVSSRGEPVARCAEGSGEVQVRRKGQPYWEPLAVGDELRAGDWVRTGSPGYAKVEFLSGGGLELEEKAVVAIDAAPAAAAPAGEPPSPPVAAVAVESGVVRGFTQPVEEGRAAQPLVIKNKDGSSTRLTAKAGEKPVRFRLTGGEQQTELALFEGEAKLQSDQGERELKGGQAAVLAPAAAPVVTDLIDFPASSEPGIDARYLFRGDLSIKLAWKPVAEAAGYRVQVARDLSFQTLAVNAELDSTEYTFKPLLQGLYAWRVAARDAQGRYGEFGFVRRIFCEKEQPRDLLIGPADGSTVSYAQKPPALVFTWQSAENAQLYRLVVGAGPDLMRSSVLSKVSSEQRVEVEKLTAGEYYWGAFVEGKSPEPIFLKPRKLVLKKVGGSRVKAPKKISDWGK